MVDKIEVGDLVEGIYRDKKTVMGIVRHIGVLDEGGYIDSVWSEWDREWNYKISRDNLSYFRISDVRLVKKGDKMCLYDDLKLRIGKLNNGWDKEADDIFNIIMANTIYESTLEIRIDSGGIGLYEYCCGQYVTKINRRTSSQCEKMGAFKDILVLLLDNSSIKKDAKREGLEQLEGKIKALQSEIDELKMRNK